MRLSRRLLIVTALSLLPIVAVSACLVLALARSRHPQSAGSPARLLDQSFVDAGLVAIASALALVIAFRLGRRLVLRPAEAIFSLRLAEREAERNQQAEALERRLAERTRALSESNNRLQVEIAERQRIEAVLRRAQKIHVMGQLVGGIAHDFNNMLATILGSLELMERLLPENSDRLRRQIERAIAAVQRSAQLTRRLLAFARREPPTIRATDINALLTDLIGLVAVALGRRIRIETGLAPDLWPAMVDPNGLEAAVLNLALNGREAMPEGGVVTIATANTTLSEDADPELEAGDYVCITVTDSGTGMSSEVQARAVEPFYSTKGPGGSGLGLSQVAGTVRRAGGAVRIRSEPGHGPQVTLLLPRSRSSAEPVAPAAQAERSAPPTAPLVLVVDDDTAVRNVTSDMLKDLGCNVLEAEGGREALDLLERRRDDVTLAVVDYAMPEMNGVQLARAIRERGIRAPIVLATGYAELAEPLDSRSSPLSIVLHKPFTINQLQTTITRFHARG